MPPISPLLAFFALPFVKPGDSPFSKAPEFKVLQPGLTSSTDLEHPESAMQGFTLCSEVCSLFLPKAAVLAGFKYPQLTYRESSAWRLLEFPGRELIYQVPTWGSGARQGLHLVGKQGPA